MIRELAADLAAETFAVALDGARKYRRDGAPASAWLIGIARNTLVSSVRRSQVEDRARRRLGMEPIALDDELLDRIERLGGDARVEALLARLTARAVRRRPRAGARREDYAGIAQRLRCSESVVRQRVTAGSRSCADPRGGRHDRVPRVCVMRWSARRARRRRRRRVTAPPPTFAVAAVALVALVTAARAAERERAVASAAAAVEPQRRALERRSRSSAREATRAPPPAGVVSRRCGCPPRLALARSSANRGASSPRRSSPARASPSCLLALAAAGSTTTCGLAADAIGEATPLRISAGRRLAAWFVPRQQRRSRGPC